MHAFVNTAIKAARKAGDYTLRAVENVNELKISTKSKNNFVTTTDLACERVIIETLEQAYPDHAFLAEEGGLHGDENAEYRWVIDPIDGTTNFINGYPHFCISIALLRRGRVEHAVVYDPTRDDIYSASQGSGAQKNNRRIRVSQERKLENALIGSVLPSSQSQLRDRFFDISKTLSAECRTLRIAGASALDLSFVAAGHLDAFWSVGLKPWDVAAASLLIKEAGGVVVDFDGGENYLESGNIIAGNPRVLKQLVEHLKVLKPALQT